jgi:hypothetical protein
VLLPVPILSQIFYSLLSYCLNLLSPLTFGLFEMTFWVILQESLAVWQAANNDAVRSFIKVSFIAVSGQVFEYTVQYSVQFAVQCSCKTSPHLGMMLYRYVRRGCDDYDSAVRWVAVSFTLHPHFTRTKNVPHTAGRVAEWQWTENRTAAVCCAICHHLDLQSGLQFRAFCLEILGAVVTELRRSNVPAT